jgi:hypothetical protein
MLVAAVVPSTKVFCRRSFSPDPAGHFPRGAKRPAPAPLSATLRLRCARALASCKVGPSLQNANKEKSNDHELHQIHQRRHRDRQGHRLHLDPDLRPRHHGRARSREHENPMAPTHRVLGRSPRGKLVECGGIWKKQNKEGTGADYYTLTIRDHGFSTPTSARPRTRTICPPLQAVIPWGPKGTPPKPRARPLRRSGYFSL